MAYDNIINKLGRGSRVILNNDPKTYYLKNIANNFTHAYLTLDNNDKIFYKPLNSIKKIDGKFITEQPMTLKKILSEEIDNEIQNRKEEILTFEKDPLEYIIKKYPSLEATLEELMTSVFRDYLTGIYVMAPKPTTFKILLHNGQSFYLTYNPKAYIAKIAGKQYHLMNIKDEEYAMKAITDLLLMGMPPGSEGPGEEDSNEKDMKDEFVSDLTSEPGEETEETDNEESEEELQEVEVPKPPKKFKIIK